MNAVKTTSPEQTLQFAIKWAHRLKNGDIVGLVGPLGSGKTLFVKGVAKTLGVEEVVNSPTFVFATEYKGKFPIYHLDLYRIERPSDVETIGLEEYLDQEGVIFIEWAEKVKELLPKKTIWVKFEILGENKRKIEIAS